MYCTECGARLGDENAKFCRECGADLTSDISEKGDWQEKLGEKAKKAGKITYDTAKEIMGEVFDSAKSNVKKNALKTGKKLTNTILKEVGLKPKTPVDKIKKAAKSVAKKLKK